MYITTQRTIIIGCVLMLISTLALIKQQRVKNGKAITIGILQTISHPALDQAREGYITTLQKELGADTIDCMVHNAQGNVANAQTIAHSYHADASIQAVYALGTMATQAISSLETIKPIIIAAVTDPWSLGILHKDTNVCGMSDMIDAQAQVELLKELLPEVKTVALPYTTSEMNSITQVKALHKALTIAGLEPVEIGICQESDIPAALQLACTKADAIVTPTDNAIVAAMDVVAKIARDHKRPLIVSDSPSINKGALVVLGIDYYQSGVAAALQTIKVLQDKISPAQVGVHKTAENKVIINKKTVELLGIHVPATLAARAEYVE